MTDRELDALVAEKVMGWHYCEVPGVPYLYDDAGRDRWTPDRGPHFSSDIAAAWQVVEKMKERQWNFTIADLVKNKWRAEFGGSRKHKQTWEDADTAPRAICLAALKAVGVAPSKEKDAEPCGNTGCAKDHDALGRHQP